MKEQTVELVRMPVVGWVVTGEPHKYGFAIALVGGTAPEDYYAVIEDSDSISNVWGVLPTSVPTVKVHAIRQEAGSRSVYLGVETYLPSGAVLAEGRLFTDPKELDAFWREKGEEALEPEQQAIQQARGAQSA